MIEAFARRWFESLNDTRAKLAAKHPESYMDIVRIAVEAAIPRGDGYGESMDPSRIHQVDDGGYHGTLVFVIGASGCQPSRYWYVRVSYGSCSGCDTLEGIRHYDDGIPSEEQVKQYLQLALNVVQGLREMEGAAT